MLFRSTNCSDIDYSLLRQDPTFFDQPYSVALQDPSVTYTLNYSFPYLVGTELRTLVNGSLYAVNDTAEPTLYAIQQDPTWMPPPTEQRNLLTIPDQYRGENVRIVVLVTGRGTHPFHTHGHAFQVLGSGIGSFDDAALAKVNAVNLRDVIVRDTAVVQGGGWLVIQYMFPRSPRNMQRGLTRWCLPRRFTANNPGVWALHCHDGELKLILGYLRTVFSTITYCPLFANEIITPFDWTLSPVLLMMVG